MGYAQILEFPSNRIKKTSLKPHRIDSEAFLGQMVGKGLTDVSMRELAYKFENPKSEREFRNKVIFLLASTTGLRAKELVSLRYSGLIQSPEGDLLIKYVMKGGKTGFSVLSQNILEEVRKYHAFIGEKTDLFILSMPLKNGKARSQLSTRGLQLIINDWGVNTASGKKIHPHALRHTVAQKTFDIFGSIATQKILGHSSANTTSNYYTRPYFNAGSVLSWT
ncbi:integrase/recombinase XerC [Leptospira meyeri]|uniref:Integrase/recombinase XerC n=1 Tax=Leptospira meyeri TaxID=29508 RepID=A0A4R8MPR5_LEPME|nr:tyrosine-type recombinase/integrase [Leptospira meyeri]EKJ85681.1 site-specific recombinase, phage integrase family [Leptospira meyeri serovar Hardjo str. Went 5]TDY71339.1 integrase/recombinase XerC [Leptospira meyeri]